MTVYTCKDSFEGILTGVYDAWMSRKGHSNVRLETAGQYSTMELFCDYIDVIPDEEKVEKVIRSVRTRISEAAYEAIYKASLSRNGEKADHIYRFLIRGVPEGSRHHPEPPAARGIPDIRYVQESRQRGASGD